MKWLILSLVLFVSQLQAAEVVDVSRDARFERPIAEDGMRNPEFFRYFGVYASEPVQSGKEVVLFVHGAKGSPRDFVDVASKLDHSRQQAWFAYYATGNSVAQSGNALALEVFNAMRDAGVTRVRVVAHSMGGLVAWHLVKALEVLINVEQFVTVATPWNGHWAARLGKWFSLNPSASWLDMVPGSDTLNAIWNQPLETELTLVYAIKEDSESADGDGTISRESQLVPAMQIRASEIVKLVADHVSVLHGQGADSIVALLQDRN